MQTDLQLGLSLVKKIAELEQGPFLTTPASGGKKKAAALKAEPWTGLSLGPWEGEGCRTRVLENSPSHTWGNKTPPPAIINPLLIGGQRIFL